MARIKAPLPKEYLEEPYRTMEEPLSRLVLAQQMTALYKGLEHGTVSVLNGRWGSGKSTFARKLVHHLDAEGLAVTYFDAFAQDYVDSPFLALSTHLVREIEQRGNSAKPSSKKIKDASKGVSKRLVGISAKTLVKAVTLGIIGSSEIDEIIAVAGDIGDASGALAEQASDYAFDHVLESESEFERFRSSLGGLSDALGARAEDGSGQKTVFIIDELDRCRPDFALGILEVIKHLFDNDRVHFILVTNIDYLIASVNSKYGLGDNSKEYLNKFYDFIVFFEQRSSGTYDHAASTLVERRLCQILEGQNVGGVSDLTESLQEFVRAFDFTLREASSLATNAALSFLAYNNRSFRPSTLIACLALYRSRFPEIYQEIKKGTYTSSQLLSVFESVTFDNEFFEGKVRDILHFYSAKDDEIDRNADAYRGFSGMTARYNFHSYRAVLPILANSVMDNFGTLDG